jgi:GNAT superfamily N-acetyltransferase
VTTPASPYRIEILSKAHIRDGFSSGEAPLDRYLQQQARQDADRRVAAAFVLLVPESHQIVGYYTLSSSLIDVGQLPADVAKRMPRYPHLPVTLLARLARDERVRDKGAGEFLLMDALARALQTAAHIGSMAVVVDAKNDRAEKFYKSFDFQVVQDEPRRLMLPMSVVAQIF